ncbi:MAG: hypothetical protein M0R49_01655 [Limnochordia bacterium]|nr:hypothetical protein [Limnochordia bacterium]
MAPCVAPELDNGVIVGVGVTPHEGIYGVVETGGVAGGVVVVTGVVGGVTAGVGVETFRAAC